eukprot:403362006
MIERVQSTLRNSQGRQQNPINCEGMIYFSGCLSDQADINRTSINDERIERWVCSVCKIKVCRKCIQKSHAIQNARIDDDLMDFQSSLISCIYLQIMKDIYVETKKTENIITGYLKNYLYQLVILGITNSGKSTLINKLLNFDLLNTNSEKETNFRWRIRFFKEGRSQPRFESFNSSDSSSRQNSSNFKSTDSQKEQQDNFDMVFQQQNSREGTQNFMGQPDLTYPPRYELQKRVRDPNGRQVSGSVIKIDSIERLKEEIKKNSTVSIKKRQSTQYQAQNTEDVQIVLEEELLEFRTYTDEIIINLYNHPTKLDLPQDIEIVDFPGLDDSFCQESINRYVSKNKHSILPIIIFQADQGSLAIDELKPIIKYFGQNRHQFSVPFVLTQFSQMYKNAKQMLRHKKNAGEADLIKQIQPSIDKLKFQVQQAFPQNTIDIYDYGLIPKNGYFKLHYSTNELRLISQEEAKKNKDKEDQICISLSVDQIRKNIKNLLSTVILQNSFEAKVKILYDELFQAYQDFKLKVFSEQSAFSYQQNKLDKVKTSLFQNQSILQQCVSNSLQRLPYLIIQELENLNEQPEIHARNPEQYRTAIQVKFSTFKLKFKKEFEDASFSSAFGFKLASEYVLKNVPTQIMNRILIVIKMIHPEQLIPTQRNPQTITNTIIRIVLEDSYVDQLFKKLEKLLKKDEQKLMALAIDTISKEKKQKDSEFLLKQHLRQNYNIDIDQIEENLNIIQEIGAISFTMHEGQRFSTYTRTTDVKNIKKIDREKVKKQVEEEREISSFE